MTPQKKWLFALFVGYFGIALSLGCGFTSLFDGILSTETLTPVLLNKEIVFGISLIISFFIAGLAQHFLAKLNREDMRHHINIP